MSSIKSRQISPGCALDSPNLIVTPHVGFHTKEANEGLFRIAVENLVRFARDAPQNVVA